MRALTAALALAGTWLVLTSSSSLEPLERLTAQARYWLRPAPGFHTPITIVGIDERSLRGLGQMPWDRRVFARLLDRVADARASAVGVDVAFTEPARDPGEDAALATAIARTPTVLPTFLAYSEAGRQAMSAVDPQPAFAHAAAGLGSVQLASFVQQVVWEVEPYQDTPARRVPAFPVAVVSAYQRAGWVAPEHGWLWRGAPSLIDFHGPANAAPQVSAIDLLQGKVAPAALANHIVLIGAVATGLADTNFAVADSRGGPMAGVEIFANVVDDILGGGFQHRFTLPALALLLALFAVGPGRFVAAGTASSNRRTQALAATTVAWLLLSFVAFGFGVWLEVVPVVGLMVSCYLVGLSSERTYLLESRNQLLARYAQDLAGEAHRQRSRIEGELHDGIQQLLIVFRRELRGLRKHAADAERTRVEFLEGLADQADQEVRRLRADLLPAALRSGDLTEALPSLVREFNARGRLHATVDVQAWERLPGELESELYWMVKEALNNAEKHAAASDVIVRLARGHDGAKVEVQDNGHGFVVPDLSIAPQGLDHSGLHRMWLRMRGNRGDLRVVSAPGKGTTIQFSLPVEAIGRRS